LFQRNIFSTLVANVTKFRKLLTAKPSRCLGGRAKAVGTSCLNQLISAPHSLPIKLGRYLFETHRFRTDNVVLNQGQSLLQHLHDGWQFGGLLQEQFIIPVPAQMRSLGET
jgi:hypothetical protein